MPIIAIILSAIVAVATGLCLITAIPEMTQLQAATWAGAVFALVCAPSLAAIFAQRMREREDDEEGAE